MKLHNIPFSPPDIGPAEAQEVTQALLPGGSPRPAHQRVEREIAAYCHTEKAVCLNSATACMEMILRVLGVGPGDEVITSAYTYTATASVTCHVGAKVVLVDTAPGSFEMDSTSWPMRSPKKPKSVIPVDRGWHRLRLRPYFRSGRKPQTTIPPHERIAESLRPGHRSCGCRPRFRSKTCGPGLRRNRRFHLFLLPCR